MANNIDVNKTIADIDKLNNSLAETANRIKSIVEIQQASNKELNTIKGLTATNEKLNKTKQAQNQIEIEGEKLLRQRNSLVASQSKLLETITKDTIKEQIAKKEYIARLKEEITGEKAAKEAKIQAAKAAKEKAAADKVSAREAAKAAKEKAAADKVSAREAAKAAKEAEKNKSAYYKLSQQYSNAAKKAKDLAAQYGVNSKQARVAANEANKYGDKLKNIDKSLGQNQRNVGGYFKSMTKSILAAGAAMLSLRAAFNVLKNSIKTIASFEEAMSKVKAITMALPDDFRKLQKNAKLLGSSTSKTAKEVAGLQLEFAKLGFTTKEILNATEATIQLSIAAGSDLANSAVVAASTIRGFGLDAKDTQRVVDVMAKSFSSSALDLEKFKTGMAIAAPISKAFGKDIEFTTARLSVLSDAGLDASTAGTSLRNIFLELSRRGMTWEEGLQKINSSTNKNVTALNLFGKRGATAALILADNIDKADRLEKAYDGAAGSAAEMARIMEDNLIGDTKKLSSAWEGFILGLNKGEGAISNVFRKTVQWLTSVVNMLEGANKSQEELVKSVKEARLVESMMQDEKELNALVEKYKERYDETTAYNKALEDQIKLIEMEWTWDDAVANTIGKRIENLKSLKPAQKENINNLEEELKAQNELYLAYRKTMEQKAKGIKVPTFAEWKRDLESNKAKAKKDWEDTVAYIFNTKNGTIISRPTELTIKAKNLSKDILDAINATVDDSPVTFWDKLLTLPADKLQETVGQFQDLGNVLFDLGSAQRERELSEVQANYDARMKAAEGNAQLQEKLQKELEQEQKRINRESAIAERNNAIFNVAMNTAVAVSKVWGQTGIFGIAAEIPVLAMGALQTAAILSRPIPGFFKGTENAPAGLAWVAEHGAELITTKSGEQYLAKEKQIVNFSGGEKVDTAADTQRLLNSAIYNDIAVNGNTGMEARMDKMISRLENLNQLNVNFDEKGMTIYAQQGKSITKYLNSKGRK